MKLGDLVSDRWLVRGLCSDSGGMGCILHVEDTVGAYEFPLVLKYCRETHDEFVKRFQREVRLLSEFRGNSKIVEIVDHQMEHQPPYFVMRFYPGGDLTNVADRVRTDLTFQERIFNQMIDCISELHARDTFHRDIKPQNFLLNGDSMVVTDLGVSKEVGSVTAGTRSSLYMGTVGYIPPEFFAPGGFKAADSASDIFMLGKSFYVLLTGRDPNYPTPDGVPDTLWPVIERCFATKKEHRYADLGSLRQRLTTAYDLLLGRKHGAGEVEQLLTAIQDSVRTTSQFTEPEVKKFIELLQTLPEDDRTRIIFETKSEFFRVLVHPTMQSHISAFLDTYAKMVEEATYSWSYAETIADNMKRLFEAPSIEPAHRVRALELGIVAAYRQNRFAAMDTCRAIVFNISDEALAMRVAEMLSRHMETFIGDIDPSSCKATALRDVFARRRGECRV